MSLPEWVRAECRKAMRKPAKSMTEKVANTKEAAYKHGYLHDHVSGEFVYVGPEPEPRCAPVNGLGTARSSTHA